MDTQRTPERTVVMRIKYYKESRKLSIANLYTRWHVDHIQRFVIRSVIEGKGWPNTPGVRIEGKYSKNQVDEVLGRFSNPC